MLSDFANFWQKHTQGNLQQNACLQPTIPGSMGCKTRNDFYDTDRTHDTVALLAHAAAAQFTASDLWPLNGSDLNRIQ